jgi:hypothetical protein
MVRNSSYVILLKLGSTAPLVKQRNLSLTLTLRRGPWTVFKLPDRAGLIEAGVNVFEDIDRNEQ